MDFTKFDSLLKKQKSQLLKAIDRVEKSLAKASKLPTDPEHLTDDELEVWEGLVSRFSRASDVFLSKYLRTFVLRADPAFQGSFRDFVEQGEKLGLIDNAKDWMNIRELRNRTAHEYAEEKLAAIFESVKQECPRIIALKKIP